MCVINITNFDITLHLHLTTCLGCHSQQEIFLMFLDRLRNPFVLQPTCMVNHKKLYFRLK